MKKLAIIGGSYLQLPIVKKAKEMGVEVHCFSWRDGAVCADVADYFYPISIIEKDEIPVFIAPEKQDNTRNSAQYNISRNLLRIKSDL